MGLLPNDKPYELRLSALLAGTEGGIRFDVLVQKSPAL